MTRHACIGPHTLGGMTRHMQLGIQDEGTRGVQHLEAVRLRVREQKELLAGANKEMKRLRKTLKTYEVLTLYHVYTYQPASSKSSS